MTKLNNSPFLTVETAMEQGRQYAEHDHDVQHAPWSFLADMTTEERVKFARERAYWAMRNVDDRFNMEREEAFVRQALDLWKKRAAVEFANDRNWMSRVPAGMNPDYPDLPGGMSYND